MTIKHWARLIAAIVALHFLGLSMVFGFHHVGYTAVAISSATFCWIAGNYLSGRFQRLGLSPLLALSIASRLIAYQAWKPELPGFGLSLAQFMAVQYLVVFAFWKAPA